MDVVCSFGRSVDVDGDEWIDLGLPPTPRGGEDDGTELLSLTPGEMRTADIDDKNPLRRLEKPRTSRWLLLYRLRSLCQSLSQLTRRNESLSRLSWRVTQTSSRSQSAKSRVQPHLPP